MVCAKSKPTDILGWDAGIVYTLEVHQFGKTPLSGGITKRFKILKGFCFFESMKLLHDLFQPFRGHLVFRGFREFP